MPLLSKPRKTYGAKYVDHYFAQYELYLRAVESVSERRLQANNYFITINTAFISLIGLASNNILWEATRQILVMLTAVGVLLCYVFWFLIRSYKQLNSKKFEVIHEIEKELPLALYDYEWEKLGSGKDYKKYFPFSHVELLIPWCFATVYAVLLIYFLASPAVPALP